MSKTFQNVFNDTELTIKAAYYGDIAINASGNNGTLGGTHFSPADAREMAAELIRLADLKDPRPELHADQGKGMYVGLVQDGSEWGSVISPRIVTLLDRDNNEIVTDFDRAVELVSEAVSNGNPSGTTEVVEVTVNRRAVIKRAVEVVLV